MNIGNAFVHREGTVYFKNARAVAFLERFKNLGGKDGYLPTAEVDRLDREVRKRTVDLRATQLTS